MSDPLLVDDYIAPELQTAREVARWGSEEWKAVASERSWTIHALSEAALELALLSGLDVDETSRMVVSSWHLATERWEW